MNADPLVLVEDYFEERRLSYRRNWIQSERITLVLLHGHGASSSEWADYEYYFSNNYNLVSVDFRGHGKSGRPIMYALYTPREAALDVAELLSFLGVKKCVLIGHSLGALVSFELNAMVRSQVSGLVLVSPVCASLPFSSVLRPLLRAMTPIIRLMGSGRSRTRVDYTRFRESKERDLRRMWTELRNCGCRSYFYWTRQTYEHATDPGWHSVVTPVLIISGDGDSVTRFEHAVALSRRLTRSQLIKFEREDHMLLLRRSPEIARLILDYISSSIVSGHNHV
jgi:3-oxoadipate enol-lactonase